MHRTPRPLLTVAALAAIGGFAAAMGGCPSKPTQPESTTAKPAAKPQARPTDTGAPPGAEASAGSSASADARTSAGGGASANAADGSAIPPDRPQTSDERRAALDKRLNDSLGSFDEQLRKERQQIARERDAHQATVTTVAAVDGDPKPDRNQNGEVAETAATELPHKSSDSHRGATDSPSARSGDLKSDKAAGAAGNARGNGAVATEIPDGNDDDVIARRLRKAAEQETDPELKDKLWKEYVEYKKNTPGR
jgi:hypothetical protein